MRAAPKARPPGSAAEGLVSAYPHPVWENADVLLRGAFGTLRLFAICAVAGLLLGLVIGPARHSPHRPWRWPATCVRRVLPQHAGAGADPVVLFRAADPAAGGDRPACRRGAGHLAELGGIHREIMRGGIASIEHGQWEGARALGMTGGQAMARVVLPQALRRMLPALTNRGIEIFKMSTLASAVAYVELLQQGKLLGLGAELQPDRDLHGDRDRVLPVPCCRWCRPPTRSNAAWGGDALDDQASIRAEGMFADRRGAAHRLRRHARRPHSGDPRRQRLGQEHAAGAA